MPSPGLRLSLSASSRVAKEGLVVEQQAVAKFDEMGGTMLCGDDRVAAKRLGPEDMETKGHGDPFGHILNKLASNRAGTRPTAKFVQPQGGKYQDLDARALLTDVEQSIRPMRAEEKEAARSG